MSYDTVIIGAGVGGLSAAIRLAAAGQRVLLLEQNAQVGGKMGEVTEAGFRWDTGPSVITMRHVFEDLFRAAGRRLEDYLTLLPVEPLTRYFYPDGVVLDATRDLQRMAEQIERLEPRDVEGYLAYLSYAARLHRITGPAFIYGEPVSLRTFRQVPVWDWIHVDGWRTMHQAICSFVRSPHLRQLLGRFATYVGASPYLAPATLNVIAHVELTGGVWYPQGGVYAIARALSRLACEQGVEIRTGARVEQIAVRGGRAAGVMVAGDFIPARYVLSNVDVANTYAKLLPAGAVPARTLRLLTEAEPSVSGFILLLGVRGEHPQLAHHNIFFCADYAREFDDLFRRGLPPGDPTVYVAITGKRDPAHALPGCENWFVLVNAPPLGPRFDWARRAGEYRDRVLATLAQRGVDIRGRIVVEKMLTPIDLERLTGARRGALYGASSNDRLAAFRRPPNRSREVPGLYFAGGTVHPGGGVPMAMLSGAAAARRILASR
ncbi:MAG: phytoene desaturase family protein [Anaerolineales bacterium]|nr:phytoene desaturase family protein [Anaerolineales bacterium]